MNKKNLTEEELIEYYLGKDSFKDIYFRTDEFPAAYDEISAEGLHIEKLINEDFKNPWFPDIEYKFNSLGYRDDKEYSVDEFRGKQLVICLGCTDTFGRHLHKEKIWPFLLSKGLPQYSVLNIGLIGASRDTISRKLIQLSQILSEEIKFVCILWPHPNRREFVSKEYTKIITTHDKTDLPFDDYWDFIDWKSNNYNQFKNYHLIKYLCSANNIQMLDLEIDRFDKKVPFDYAGKFYALGEKSHKAITNYFLKKIKGEPSLFDKIKYG